MKARLYELLEWLFTFVVPKRWRYAMARGAAKALCRIDRSRRLIIEANLAPFIGQEQAHKRAPALLAGFATTAVDFFCQPADVLKKVTIENNAALEAAYRSGGRVMAVTAHLGHWEIGLSCLAQVGYPVTGVYSSFSDPRIDRWMKRHRDSRVDWVPVGSNVVRRCLDALERHRVVGMVVDVPFGEKGRHVLIAGHPTRLPAGPWMIARRAKAVVFPCFIVRESSGRYRARIHHPIEPRRGTMHQDIERMQTIFIGHLEHYLTNYPEQWGLLSPFWERAGAKN